MRKQEKPETKKESEYEISGIFKRTWNDRICCAVIRLCDRTLLYSICTCKRTVWADGISYTDVPNCLVDKGIGISNDPALCGKELNESYCGTENDVIISCGGGELMCEVVPYIDFAGIAQAKPKWYMGFSDNTNFTFLSATIADTAAVYTVRSRV